MNKSKRGFASMPADQVKTIARLGGQSVSRNREFMAEIGRKGGKASYRNRIDREVLQ